MNPIEYDLYPKPRPMHIILENGTKKFSFAGAKNWEDLETTGPTYPLGANVEIVAEARVPIGEDTATYFMDALAVGTDFNETHLPAYTVGFNHTQLEDGYIEPEKKPIPPEREKRIKVMLQADKDQPNPDMASWPTTEIDYRTVDDSIESQKWLSTYVHYETPLLYTAKADEWVKDFMGKRTDKLLRANSEVLIAGTFINEDIVYARPLLAQKNFLWYGIRIDNLISDEELYNTNIPLQERAALPHGRLSTSERYVVVPLAKAISKTTQLRARLGKNKNNKNKEN